jgi:hypothetical protein
MEHNQTEMTEKEGPQGVVSQNPRLCNNKHFKTSIGV